MDAPVTPVTSGKPRSRIHVQNFIAVEGLSVPDFENMSTLGSVNCEAKKPVLIGLFEDVGPRPTALEKDCNQDQWSYRTGYSLVRSLVHFWSYGPDLKALYSFVFSL